MRIEYGIWSPDRETFIATMQALVNPITQTPLLGEDGRWSRYVRCVELGQVMQTPPQFDGEGNEVVAAEYVAGHHADLYAVGALAALLVSGMPESGTVFQRTRILQFLGTMTLAGSEVGEPDGLVGASGVKLFDKAVIATPAHGMC